MRQIKPSRIKRFVPLKSLPRYADDDELGLSIMGEDRVAEWPLVLRIWQAQKHPVFPPFNPLMGGRYVPHVEEFLDALEASRRGGGAPEAANDAERQAKTWTRPRRRRA